ncbi:DMT family transporter [Azospirillum halopraeferens]|uniref:DMT family transporter n=1 Tax=Azospirillum halopraeferens TaxID=34010 RepID=UPI0003F607C0|nr:DMT family transporter [Azospirillum halopraeferens]
MDSLERVAAPAETARAATRAGIAWMVATTFLFVSQDAITRMLVQSYPVPEVAWARFSVHLALAAVLVGWQSPRLMVSRRPGLQLVRSLLLLTITLLATTALGILPFVDVTAILNATPVLITVLSIPLLGERVGWRRWLAVLVGFAGAMMIIGPASGMFQWTVLLPLGAALANALYQIVTRMLKTSDPTLTTFFYTSIVGTVLCSLALPFVWVTPDATGAALMVLLGVLGAGSHYCMIRAYTAAPAGVVAPFGYTTLVWATLWSLVIFAEVPGLLTLAGAAVIVASGVYILYREQARARSGRRE